MAMAVRSRLWCLRGILVPCRGLATPAAGEAVKAPIKVFGIEGRYAHALFSAASKKKCLEKVEEELVGFQKLVSQKPELANFISNPTLTKSQKEAALTGLLKDQKCSELTVNLFSALASNNRLPRVAGVIRAYASIMSAYRGEVPCAVTTSKPVDDKTRKELERVLQGFLDKQQVLQLNMKVDQAIIGGMVVEVGDKYIDMSTSTKVKKLVNVLREAV